MTFLAQEMSQADGRPVELFLFKTALQSIGVAFTNSEDDIVFGNETYQAIGISRSEASYSEEADSGSVSISVPQALEFVRQFIIIPPGDNYRVTIYRRHITDSAVETVTWWKGFIGRVQWEGATARIECKPLLELFSRIGPRMNFQQPCNHVLYDTRCAVVENDFRFLSAPSSVSIDGTELTFSGISSNPPLTDAPSGFQGNYYVGGFIRIPTNNDFRLITDQSGDVLTIQFPFFESPAGKTLDVFAGCDHQINTCVGKFNNLENQGGHHYLPVRNIFTKGLDETGGGAGRAKDFIGQDLLNEVL